MFRLVLSSLVILTVSPVPGMPGLQLAAVAQLPVVPIHESVAACDLCVHCAHTAAVRITTEDRLRGCWRFRPEENLLANERLDVCRMDRPPLSERMMGRGLFPSL